MKNITEARDPDLRASAAAIRRAADLARKTAIQTNTNQIVMTNGKFTRIPAQALQATVENRAKKTAFPVDFEEFEREK